ncbi:DEAH helicase, winged-helix domain [Fusarium oxysporum f. sp. vasinfectum]|nr:DEAH helicase, winged-helix domain [Fusarium oxysporum f. sp. vasinfectum]
MEDLKRNKTTAAQAIGIEDSKDHLFRPGKKHTVKYFELLKQRRARPVSSRRQEFLDAYHQYQVIVLSSETGSEETTQMPQFILFNEWEKQRKIACTQPLQDGEEVGYAVRFDRKAHPMKAKLGHMTDGMLTEVAKTDSISNLYAYIITDEAHECTLSTDTAGLTQDLKLVVMLATLDAEEFVSYFGSEKTTHFALSGKNQPVQITYLKESVLAVFSVALMIVKDIHDKERDGDILVFFQSVQEVYETCTLLRKEIGDLNVLPLYSQLPESQKDLIFQTSTQGKCPRFYYRLYTHKSFMEEMRPSNQPQILESDMASHILQLKAMGFDDVARFDFIDPPHPEILLNGLQDLIFM